MFRCSSCDGLQHWPLHLKPRKANVLLFLGFGKNWIISLIWKGFKAHLIWEDTDKHLLVVPLDCVILTSSYYDVYFKLNLKM